MITAANTFLKDERGAITVDWVVLSGAAVAMAIAASDVVQDGLDVLTSDLEAQLRTQQISDAFVGFDSSHFDKLYDIGMITEEQAGELFDTMNALTNDEILTLLEDGIPEMLDGTLSDAELQSLYAAASVAYQRNIIADEVIETYFGDDDGNYGNTDGDGEGAETT